MAGADPRFLEGGTAIANIIFNSFENPYAIKRKFGKRVRVRDVADLINSRFRSRTSCLILHPPSHLPAKGKPLLL